MRKRILIAILSVTIIAIILFAIPLAVVVSQLVDEDAALRVERQAVLAARGVPADFARGDDPVELPETTAGVSLGLYGADGRLISGVGPPVAEPAIRSALANQVVDAELPGRRVVAVPVAANEQVVGLIRAEQSTAASDGRSRNILVFLAGLAIVVLSIGAVIGSLLAGRLARPVRRLRDAAVELGRGNFTVGVPPSSIPELDQAAAALTTTGQRLEELVARERSFSADASHQLRTPVAGIRAAIETELRFPRNEPALVLHEALKDIDRLERTITELLVIARTPHVADSMMSLRDIIGEVGPRWEPRLARDGRSFVVEVADDLPSVWGDPSMVKHVLDVLLDNAQRHGGGEVRITVTASGTSVTVSVSDEGPGLGDRKDSANTGLSGTSDPTHGLGLPLARRYLETMRGKLVITRPGPSPRIDMVLRRAVVPSSYPPLA